MYALYMYVIIKYPSVLVSNTPALAIVYSQRDPASQTSSSSRGHNSESDRISTLVNCGLFFSLELHNALLKGPGAPPFPRRRTRELGHLGHLGSVGAVLLCVSFLNDRRSIDRSILARIAV